MAYKILVVDDEKDLRDLISYFLKRENYEVSTAENGKEAFDKIQTWQPQLVISDIRMPVWDGFELIKQMEQLQSPKVPILFISGYVGGDEESLKKSSQCLGFISKPVNKSDLIRIVKEAEKQNPIHA